MSSTKIAAEARARIATGWPEHQRAWAETVGQMEAGRRLSERDVEFLLPVLVEKVLGWEIGQLARQQDFADFALIDRGLKLAVIETKGFDAFRDLVRADEALTQGARYADRHRTPIIGAYDGCQLLLARHTCAVYRAVACTERAETVSYLRQ